MLSFTITEKRVHSSTANIQLTRSPSTSLTKLLPDNMRTSSYKINLRFNIFNLYNKFIILFRRFYSWVCLFIKWKDFAVSVCFEKFRRGWEEKRADEEKRKRSFPPKHNENKFSHSSWIINVRAKVLIECQGTKPYCGCLFAWNKPPLFRLPL